MGCSCSRQAQSTSNGHNSDVEFSEMDEPARGRHMGRNKRGRPWTVADTGNSPVGRRAAVGRTQSTGLAENADFYGGTVGVDRAIRIARTRGISGADRPRG